MARRIGTLSLFIVLLIGGGLATGRSAPDLLAQATSFQVFLPFVSVLDDGDNDGTFFSHYDPVFVVDIHNRVYVEDSPPAERTVIYAGGTGSLSRYIANWQVGDFTGYVPTKDYRETQRGAPSGGYGSSAVQMEGFVTGMHLRHEPGEAAEGSQFAQFHYEFRSMAPAWSRGINPRFCFDLDAAIPHSEAPGETVNYGYSLAAFEDTTTGKRLWLLMSMYDTRPDVIQRGDILSWWTEAEEPIIYGYYREGGYSSLLSGSAQSISATWGEWRYFGYCISTDELRRMVADVNREFGIGMSEDPNVYAVSSLAVGPEMYNPDGAAASISMRVKDVRLYTLADPE